MPDIITTEERAAINAAVEAGKVQRIPRGQSAFEVVYNPETKALTYCASGASTYWQRSTQRGQARSARGKTGPQAAKSASKVKQAAEVAERVEAVSVLVDQGMHRAEIMAAMPEITEAQLTYAFRKLGVAPGRNVEAIRKRRARVAEMADAGTWSGPAICAELGIERATLAKDLKATGKSLPRSLPKPAEELEPYRKKIAEMTAKGIGRREIGKAIGKSIAVVERIARRFGIALVCKRGREGNPRPHVAKRLVQIAKLQAQGLTVREIADRIGKCPKATRKDLVNLGLRAAPAIPSKAKN